MAIAKKAVVWGLFAAGVTVAAFLFPALIALYLLVALGNVHTGLQYENNHAFASGWICESVGSVGISLALWHAAHRLRVVFHDFGVRMDKTGARAVYLVAAIGTALTAYYVYAL